MKRRVDNPQVSRGVLIAMPVTTTIAKFQTPDPLYFRRFQPAVVARCCAQRPLNVSWDIVDDDLDAYEAELEAQRSQGLSRAVQVELCYLQFLRQQYQPPGPRSRRPRRETDESPKIPSRGGTARQRAQSTRMWLQRMGFPTWDPSMAT
ncbi:hypothetical protein KDA23_01220 [Candidatus Saccharibacteria bacterium]|nr:hypothetical protein [Candidatus Saccharibacteria bacterium]